VTGQSKPDGRAELGEPVTDDIAVGDDVSVGVRIRPASVDDADAVGKVHVRAWQSADRGVMPEDYLDVPQAQDHATRWRSI
jgi:hypothetical protein